MKRIRIKNGPVAYFDILGYHSINSSNEIEEVSQIIVDHLDGIPDSLHDFMKKSISPVGLSEKDEDKFAKSISCILLSDSVLLTGKQPIISLDAGVKLVNWLFFILACWMLMNRMFNRGLLLRGAVGYGRYFRKRNCFAGKPIIDSVRMAENLNLAGCAFVPNAWEQLQGAMEAKGLEQMADLIRSITFRYEAPLKLCTSRQSLKSQVMMVFDIEENIREKVSKAFTSYNRKITEEVKPKIENTALMIESFIKCKRGMS
jgi:hypothetical protein